MLQKIPEFQVFVKPVGAACNLRCTYCYYIGKKSFSHSPGRMTDEILERYIVQKIKASAGGLVSFSWHGGEPLMAGIDFFRKAVSVQQKNKPEDCTIINGIQSNGTLLDENWCRFLSEEKFNIGISIDGPQSLHDLYRIRYGGSPTFSDVMKGFRLLKKWKIPVEVLCVVNRSNVSQPAAVYEFCRCIGAEYITFLPLVEYKAGAENKVTPESVPPEQFGHFLNTIFDEWIANDIGKVKIQVFEEALRTAFDQDHTLCIFKKNCGGVPVIELNGDFYSCDHYADLNHRIGNIMQDSLSELLENPRQKEFGLNKSQSLPQYCLHCEVKPMCNGECPKNRFINAPDGQPGLNYLCSGYKLFFSHCLPFISAVRKQWKSVDKS